MISWGVEENKIPTSDSPFPRRLLPSSVCPASPHKGPPYHFLEDPFLPWSCSRACAWDSITLKHQRLWWGFGSRPNFLSDSASHLTQDLRSLPFVLLNPLLCHLTQHSTGLSSVSQSWSLLTKEHGLYGIRRTGCWVPCAWPTATCSCLTLYSSSVSLRFFYIGVSDVFFSAQSSLLAKQAISIMPTAKTDDLTVPISLHVRTLPVLIFLSALELRYLSISLPWSGLSPIPPTGRSIPVIPPLLYPQPSSSHCLILVYFLILTVPAWKQKSPENPKSLADLSA